MESTGVYWRPVWDLLTGTGELLLHPMSSIPGWMTDDSDAEWISDPLAEGLLKPSIVPRDRSRMGVKVVGEGNRRITARCERNCWGSCDKPGKVTARLSSVLRWGWRLTTSRGHGLRRMR